MEKKKDLRVQKTYSALMAAFEALMAEETFDDITINELCARALIRMGLRSKSLPISSRQPLPLHHVAENILRHRAAADVAVADKKHVDHQNIRSFPSGCAMIARRGANVQSPAKSGLTFRVTML